MPIPLYVVVDTNTGDIFDADFQGELFTEETAKRFAEIRNSNLRSDVPPYEVFKLTRPTEPPLGWWEG